MSNVEGLGTIKRNMQKFSKKTLPNRVEAGLIKAGLFLLKKSLEVVPVLTGLLRSTGLVTPKGNGLKTSVEVTYGPLSYAVIQHENLEFKHKPGKQAKYLEGPMRANKAELLQIIQREISKP